VLSNTITVTVIVPSSQNTGSGVFTGKTCFDIAKTNSGNNCGTPAYRSSQKTDFSNRTPQDGTNGNYSGVQVYTFTPSSAVSRVRFFYTEPANYGIVESIDYSSSYAGDNGINSPCKFTVYYRQDLNTRLQGLSRSATPFKLKLYVVYNSDAVYANPANDQVLELNITLNDCSCCGAYTDKAAGTWLNFRCHNLGSTESLNPLIPAAGLHGSKYQFGQQYAVLSMTADQNTTDAISGWNTNPSPTTGDWPTARNPCPAGWRLPTVDEWQKVVDNNAWTRVGSFNANTGNYTSGYMVGDNLFLPTAGRRYWENGYLSERGEWGHYWSSTGSSTEAYTLYFYRPDVDVMDYRRAFGYSVRCVE
jgi:uncharacterized protein (TIGR02145 family)